PVHDVRPTKGIDVLNHKTLLAASVAVLMGVAACGGSSGEDTPDASSSGGATGGTFKVGVFYDATGPAAASNKGFIEGVRAGVKLIEKDGLKFEISEADTTTSPQGATAAAQKLVQQDK